jgi:hypothetical protein
MHKSIIWIIFFLLISSCRLIPSTTKPPTYLGTEISISSQIDLAISTELLTLTQTNNPISVIPSPPEQMPSLLPTHTSSPVILPTDAQLPFALRSTPPVYIKSFTHPEKECDWMGVAGQVITSDGNPINNLVVVIRGRLGEKDINSVALTGLKEADVYGPGGYEIFLNDKIIETSKSLFIHSNDLKGNSLTQEVEFDTFADCNNNLIIINFKTIK